MSVISKIYINGVYQGDTSGTHWHTNKIYTKPPTPFGAGYYLPLPYFVVMYWRVDTYDTETELTTTGDTWIFTVQNQSSSSDSSDIHTGPQFEEDETGETLGEPIVYERPTEAEDRGYVWDSLLEEWVEDYEPDESWKFVDGEYQWTELPDVKGGGRYRNSLIVFGIDSNGKGNISVG